MHSNDYVHWCESQSYRSENNVFPLLQAVATMQTATKLTVDIYLHALCK
jgi:hypothetical protein